MSHFGLDIGSYAIKFVGTKNPGKGANITTLGSVYNSTGQILPKEERQMEQLALLIKNGVKEFNLSGETCHLALPSQLGYLSIASMPALSDAELSSAIRWEAEQHIPLSMDEVNFEYDIIHRPEKSNAAESMSVFMVGVPTETIDTYLKLLDMAGVEPIGLEPDVLSLVRAFNQEKSSKETEMKAGATMICSFGALTSVFAVIEEGRLMAVHNAAIGSLALTRAIQKDLGLDPARSEEYKRMYGMNADQLEGKVKNVIMSVLNATVTEVRKTMQFYSSTSGGKNVISRIIMTGGGANLPGLSAHLVEVLSLEVSVGNPFDQLKFNKNVSVPDDVASYSIAAGLAMKQF